MRLWLLAGVLAATGGCSSDDPQRFRVSGEVKFDGKPVPHGEVLFTPDGAKGNSGPQGIATIENGRYDTKGSRAPGVSGGPTLVRVTALADQNGKLLCEYEFSLNLAKEDTTHDIDIPASAAKAKKGVPEI